RRLGALVVADVGGGRSRGVRCARHARRPAGAGTVRARPPRRDLGRTRRERAATPGGNVLAAPASRHPSRVAQADAAALDARRAPPSTHFTALRYRNDVRGAAAALFPRRSVDSSPACGLLAASGLRPPSLGSRPLGPPAGARRE